MQEPTLISLNCQLSLWFGFLAKIEGKLGGKAMLSLGRAMTVGPPRHPGCGSSANSLEEEGKGIKTQGSREGAGSPKSGILECEKLGMRARPRSAQET